MSRFVSSDEYDSSQTGFEMRHDLWITSAISEHSTPQVEDSKLTSREWLHLRFYLLDMDTVRR